MAELQQSVDARLAQAAAATAAAAAAEVAQRQRVEAELASVRQQVAASGEASAAAQQQVAAEMEELRGKLAAMERQRAEAEVRSWEGWGGAVGAAKGTCTWWQEPRIGVLACCLHGNSLTRSPLSPPLATGEQAKAQAEKQDLLNRLNNAVAQRNAAREEALMLEAKLKQLQDDVESGRLAPVGAAAAAAAASAGMLTPPPGMAGMAGAAGGPDEGMMDRMRRFMQQIPGTSPQREGTPLATPSGTFGCWVGVGCAGGMGCCRALWVGLLLIREPGPLRRLCCSCCDSPSAAPTCPPPSRPLRGPLCRAAVGDGPPPARAVRQAAAAAAGAAHCGPGEAARGHCRQFGLPQRAPRGCGGRLPLLPAVEDVPG